MTHPTSRVDDIVHQRARLGILMLLAPAKAADFTYIRDELGLTAGNLSRHLDILELAGFVRITKGYAKRRPRTSVSITREGRAALEHELTALREIVLRMDGRGPPTGARG